MIMKFMQHLIFLTLTILLITGCATVFSGYEDRVDLITNADNIKVYTNEGVEIPISDRIVRPYSEELKKYVEKKIKTIYLRKNKDHILLFKSEDKEILVEVFPKIGTGWLIFDVITGVFPAFIDGYTGNWNSFQPIIINF